MADFMFKIVCDITDEGIHHGKEPPPEIVKKVIVAPKVSNETTVEQNRREKEKQIRQLNT